ncbi:MAG: ABC transporter ATP-binding protein [Clostridia bacterium]|nr:ABC transporter ATP-binding protein [Clostridia bacterium]
MDHEKRTQSEASTVDILKEKLHSGTIRDILRDWKWIFSFTKFRIMSVVLYTVFGMATSALALLAGVVSKYLIDAIYTFDSENVIRFALLMVTCAVLSLLLRSIASRFGAMLHIDMQNDVKALAFDSLIASEWMEISRFPTGDLLNRFTSDITTVANNAVTWLPNALIQIFSVLATLIVILYYDPIMALICFATTPILFFASRRLIQRQRDYARKMRTVSSEMSAFESETFRNIDTLKSFGVEDSVSGDLRERQRKYRQVSLEHNSFMIRTNIWLTVMSTAVQYIALGYCLWRLWNGDIMLGTMVFFLQQRGTLASSFSALIALVPSALSGSVAAERLREITELKKEPEAEPSDVAPGPCSIKISDVSVKYKNEDRYIISHAELKAGPGEIVALIGPSGEGKTTMLRMILGLIRPGEGTLELIDSKGKSFELGSSTRHCISYVPQGNTVIAGTVADNLRLVRKNVTDGEIEAVLKDACAWKFVSRLPDGINSQIGEGGKGISEGQAQRLSIARALLRRAPILLLDEATSALDSETEKKVLNNLTKHGVTCIVTTHRPSVLSMCTSIYKIENGEVTLSASVHEDDY